MRAREFMPERVNPDVINPGFRIERQLPNGMIIRATAHEPYHDDPNPDMRELRGVEIRVFDPNNKDWLHQRYGIAEVRFMARRDKTTGDWNLRPTMLHVNERYRRQGIASAMYNFARGLGNDIIPGLAQTDLGQKFWQGGAGRGRELDVDRLPEPPPPEPSAAPEPKPEPKPPSFADRWRRILFPDRRPA